MKNVFHVLIAVFTAFDKHRLVADVFLLAGDAGHIFAHGFGADLHVAHAVVAVGFGIAFPNAHTVGHEFAHGGLKIIVAYHSAGDARGAGGDAGFVDNQNVGAGALAAGFEFKG